MENDPASTPAPGNAPAGLRRSPLRSLVWTVWAAVPLLVRPVSGFSSFCAMVLLALWCAASLYLVAVPSRVDDEADPDGRRAAAKVALGLFAAVGAFSAWEWTLDLVWRRMPADEPPWLLRLDLVPKNLDLAINLSFVLLVLAPATGVFVLSQRRFLARPESIANRLLLFLGIPAVFLVTAEIWKILNVLLTVV